MSLRQGPRRRLGFPVATRDGALVIAAESEGVARWKPEEAPWKMEFK